MAFTEQGIAMLSSVFKSDSAIQVNICKKKDSRIRQETATLQLLNGK